MFKAIAFSAIGIAGVSACTPNVTGHSDLSPATTAKPACQADAVIVIADGEETPCDLNGSQTLIVKGVSELDCADMGGAWMPTVCVDVDY